MFRAEPVEFGAAHAIAPASDWRGGLVSDETEWEIPAAARPRPGEWSFDLERALAAVVAVRTEIPADAFTASILGTERAGNGVAIDQNGLILTIGYLITEAET